MGLRVSDPQKLQKLTTVFPSCVFPLALESLLEQPERIPIIIIITIKKEILFFIIFPPVSKLVTAIYKIPLSLSIKHITVYFRSPCILYIPYTKGATIENVREFVEIGRSSFH